ncbi:hypothetical protein FS837_000182 [Tulasnella sp. UAMH 9824]|nr:hypothetical protein FS837_000182 [Tulasnella sp. UAMH 9824]
MPPLLELSVSLSSKEDDDEEEDIEQAEAEIAALQASLKARMESLAKRKRIRVDDLEANISAKRRRAHDEEQ